MKIFYETLAPWWPLLSPVADYEDEAADLARVIQERSPDAQDLLELGSGGGNNAFHLKGRFRLTLTDLSAEMLAISAALNPEAEHVQGDMRTLDLGRTYDVVLAHDAIDYMTTEADLEAAFATAARHLQPGGLAVFAPDHVLERYEPGSESGGTDGPDGRSLRYLEWSLPVVPGTSHSTTHYSFLVSDADGTVRAFHEAHRNGLFATATWVSALERAGFEVEVVEERTDEDRPPRLYFVGRRA